MRLESWAGSDVGLVREVNEDSVGAFPDLGLFVVADGLGGHASGEVASRMAVESIRDFVGAAKPPAPLGLLRKTRRLFGAADDGGDDDELLCDAVRKADDAIRIAVRDATGDPDRGMATTVVVLRIQPERSRAAWVHVGDSRLYLLRRDHLELLTADHTIVGSRYRDGDSIPIDLPHSNRLLQALGTGAATDITAQHRGLEIGDVLLLCSDGVSGLIKPDALAVALASTSALDVVGAELIRLALEAGGKDNASAVLVRVVAD